MATIWRKVSDGTIHNAITATGTYQPIGEWKKTFEFTAKMGSGGQTATIQLRMGASSPQINPRWPVMALSGTDLETMSDAHGVNLQIGLGREPVLVVTAISGSLTATLVPRSDDESEAPELEGIEKITSPYASTISFAKFVNFAGATLASMALPPMKGRLSEQVYFNSGSSTLSLARSKTTDTFLTSSGAVTGISLAPNARISIVDSADGSGVVFD